MEMRAKVVTAPDMWDVLDEPQRPSVFLAGSIDNGRAVQWQLFAITRLADLPIRIMNPRRAAWYGDLHQFSPEMCVQIQWELRYLRQTDLVFFNFEYNSEAPITLLEFGIIAALAPQRAVVVCSKSFWRATNVWETCEAFGIPMPYQVLDQGLDQVRKRLWNAAEDKVA
jgi:hypothetical protein